MGLVVGNFMLISHWLIFSEKGGLQIPELRISYRSHFRYAARGWSVPSSC